MRPRGWNKFNAKKTEVDGITFDSKREAERYCELKLLERAGEITELRLQPVYELQPAYTDNENNKQRAITYRADFEYRDPDRGCIVEDVKGMELPDFKLKAKLFRYIYRGKHLVLVK